MALFTKKKPEPQSNIITKILQQGVAEGVIPERTKAAREWYGREARKIMSVNESNLMSSDPMKFRQTVQPGRMYMFVYDPKHKKTLPYYDSFPLIYPLEVYGNSFLGLNLHYLPPIYRAKLMDSLYEVLNNNRFDETTKLRLNYRILKAVSNNNYFKPCVKKYLKTHVRSRFVAVDSSAWSIAAFLPTARFEKAPQTKVWSDSVNKINFGKR